MKEEHPHDSTCVKEEWDEFLQIYVFLVKNICMRVPPRPRAHCLAAALAPPCGGGAAPTRVPCFRECTTTARAGTAAEPPPPPPAASAALARRAVDDCSPCPPRPRPLQVHALDR